MSLQCVVQITLATPGWYRALGSKPDPGVSYNRSLVPALCVSSNSKLGSQSCVSHGAQGLYFRIRFGKKASAYVIVSHYVGSSKNLTEAFTKNC